MGKVVWTAAAINDLDDIGEHISKGSVKYAEITVDRLFNAVDILEIYPNAGKMVPELDNKAVRELIRGNYRIVYLIKSTKQIDILTVHYSARLLGNTYDFGVEE